MSLLANINNYTVNNELCLTMVHTAWAQRQCISSSESCSGHGECTAAGQCVCDANYYGSSEDTACAFFCDGYLDSNTCRQNRVCYIAVQIPKGSADYEEEVAALQLAVDMVNNKTDGWVDDTPQVEFVIRLNDSSCDEDVAREALLDQEQWAKNVNGGKELDGLIGPLCSAAG
jgi:hypothetical protein